MAWLPPDFLSRTISMEKPALTYAATSHFIVCLVLQHTYFSILMRKSQHFQLKNFIKFLTKYKNFQYKFCAFLQRIFYLIILKFYYGAISKQSFFPQEWCSIISKRFCYPYERCSIINAFSEYGYETA